MNSEPATYRSAVSGVSWPAIPGAGAARMLGVLQQFEASQWWSAETLRRQQFKQAAHLLAHAWERVPVYRERLAAAGWHPGAPVDAALWTSLPLLTRDDLQTLGMELEARPPLAAHGSTWYVKSSGSSGKPVQALCSDVTRFFWQVATLREHLWHGRDFSGKLAAIRPDRLKGEIQESHAPDWGAPVNLVFDSGPSVGLNNARVGIAEQLDWLVAQQPAYILSLPSNLRELLRLSRERGIKPGALLEARSFGEVVSTELRDDVRATWGVNLVDSYSATEIGTMATQCPHNDGYHIMAETMLLEVLAEDGRACEPGEIGQVVVTPLHNFAMPLIRYRINDYAEVGEPCACGRGLPVLQQIMGRSRNLLTTPDGGRYWPSFPARNWMDIGGIRQIQMIQTRIDSIDVKLAVAQALSPAQETELTHGLHKSLPYPFKLHFEYVSDIPLQPSGKYEDFVSRLE